VIISGLEMYNKEMQDYLMNESTKFSDIGTNDVTNKINFVNLLCGLKIPNLNNMKIEKPVSKIDLKPTLLQISGLKDNFSLGMTAFSTKDYAFINNGIIILDKYYYENQMWYERENGNILNLKSLEKNEKEKLEEYEENIRTELDISTSILINNLLK
jgi:hypothetical protein